MARRRRESKEAETPETLVGRRRPRDPRHARRRPPRDQRDARITRRCSSTCCRGSWAPSRSRASRPGGSGSRWWPVGKHPRQRPPHPPLRAGHRARLRLGGRSSDDPERGSRVGAGDPLRRRRGPDHGRGGAAARPARRLLDAAGPAQRPGQPRRHRDAGGDDPRPADAAPRRGEGRRGGADPEPRRAGDARARGLWPRATAAAPQPAGARPPCPSRSPGRGRGRRRPGAPGCPGGR